MILPEDLLAADYLATDVQLINMKLTRSCDFPKRKTSRVII